MESTIIHSLESLYDKAKTSQQNNDDEQALSYYTQALDQIESTDNATQDIYQLQFDIPYNICQIWVYKWQYNLTVANELIEKALQIANISQQQDKIAQCLDTWGYIKKVFEWLRIKSINNTKNDNSFAYVKDMSKHLICGVFQGSSKK